MNTIEKLEKVREALDMVIDAASTGFISKYDQCLDDSKQAITLLDEVIAELPQYGWYLPRAKLNELQEKSISSTIKRCKQADFINLKIRINGDWEEVEADWVEHLIALPAAPKGGK
jgi:hypothetical protein